MGLFTLSLLLVNVGDGVLSRHEVLAAQPAREMLADGHWIVPTIAGEYRVNKPPTMGWLIAASMAVFRGDAEWIARLPAVLSGAFTAVLAAALTARMIGARAGLLAGLMTGSSFFVLMQARLSEADMPMAACVTLAYWAFGAATIDGTASRRRWAGLAVLFHAAVGASFLLKGVGPAFVLPACALYAAVRLDGRAARFLLFPPGLGVLLVLLVAWPVAAWMTHPAIVEAWHREVFQRVTGELNERIGKEDPWHLYFWSVPMLLLPWFPTAVVGAVVGVRRGWLRKPHGLLLACWFGVGFVILCAVAWKHKHYAIPILPACMPAAAAGLLVWMRHNYARPPKGYGLLTLLWLAGCAVGAWAAYRFAKPGGAEMAVLVGVMAAGGCVVILFERLRRPAWQLAAMFLTAWVVPAGAFLKVAPLRDGYRASTELAGRVNAIVPPGATVTLVGLGEHHLTYYLDRPMRRIDDPAIATERLSGVERPAFVLAPARVATRLGSAAPIDAVSALGRREVEGDRVTLFRLD